MLFQATSTISLYFISNIIVYEIVLKVKHFSFIVFASEFDFGAETTIERISESKFEWLCCNVVDRDTNQILTGCKLTKVLSLSSMKKIVTYFFNSLIFLIYLAGHYH
jgi:hypothetical protein